MENNMIARIASAAVLVVASVTASMPALSATYVDVRVAPPAPRYEAMPAQRPGYVWTPGYWDWRGNRHVWVSGSWVRERPGYVYTRPTWVNDNGRWHLYRGAWARGDRDGDGIPNRYDNVNNRRGDRDRDGIPNRYDNNNYTPARRPRSRRHPEPLRPRSRQRRRPQPQRPRPRRRRGAERRDSRPDNPNRR
jgi:hypothetical protein